MKNIKERDNKENYDECSGEESTYHQELGQKHGSAFLTTNEKKEAQLIT